MTVKVTDNQYGRLS